MLICFEVEAAGQCHEFTDVWGSGVKLRRRISTCFHLQRGRRRHEVPLSFYTKMQDVSFSKAEISMAIFQATISELISLTVHWTSLSQHSSFVANSYLFLCEIIPRILRKFFELLT